MEAEKPVDETTEDNTEEGDNAPASENVVDRAERISKNLEEKIKVYEKLKAEVDQAKADNLLSGTGGGAEPPKQKLDETPGEYKERVLRGDI